MCIVVTSLPKRKETRILQHIETAAMVNPEHVFHIADYCIFAITIVVSLGIGIYYALSGGKQRTTSEYFVGNRKMAILPVAISLMVSFESSIMMLGVPAEYLELRFDSHAVRILGTVLGMLSYTAYMGIVLFGPAIALEAVTGFPQWGSIVSIAAASVIYTAIGGLKAVIWTDVFQCAIMFAGVFAVLIKGTMQVGGIGKTWELAYEKGRVNIFNFDPDPTIRHTFWNLFVGSIIRGFGLIFNQSSIQRISSTPTVDAAKRVMMLVAPGFFLSVTLAGIEGVIAYAFYDTLRCDPLKSKQITNPNQIVPYMVMDIFKHLPGMPGLFMASLFSASLSTLSSGLSSLSALLWTDLLKPHVKPMSELKATIISKISVVVFGVLAAVVAFMIALIGGTLIQISGSLLAAFSGPLSGLFMFGAFCPWGNAKGAFGGSVLSAIVTFIIAMGQMTTKGAVKNTRLPSAPIDSCPAIEVANFVANMTMANNTTGITLANFTSTMSTLASSMGAVETVARGIPEPSGFRRLFMVSYKWFGPIGVLQVMIFGTIISFCTGYKKPGEVKRKYLIPFYDSLFPFLPECIRRPLRCGYHFEKDDEDDDHLPETVYNKLDDIKVDVFHVDLVIEKQNGVIDKQPKAGNHVDDKTGDAVFVDNKQSDDRISNEAHNQDDDVRVTHSVDDLSPRKMQVKDMEMDILRGGTSSDYIVMDKLDDSRVLKLRAKSIEMDIKPE
ncbi:sodium-dependent multivitamin transporter-like isoform X2 [Mercenaria mercenaria]|uniref:sodium-dependent multivitamin transporter-like isoform X2 n=1 Tax=Mercenaria mercenaria TaxID=6596 RepID=UPI00234E9011|nr:sodium-dependent multivitamin transporter-like isoform X2 [Mercenaria mercenaria]